MNNKGVSPLIASVLLVLLTLSVISAVAIAVKNIVDEDFIDESESQLNCLRNVEIELLEVCYENSILRMNVKNQRELNLGDFFLVNVYYENGTIEQIPTQYNTFIGPYEAKWIAMPYYPGTKSITVLPKVESQAFVCVDSAKSFDNIMECELDENQ